ncbi:MAG: BON domain-containing protein [Gemmatimonadaceae bacterium]
MADDFDNSDEIENLSDDELAEYVRNQLREQPMLDGDSLGVGAHEGRVTVTGTVGTEEEQRILDHVLSDTIGLVDYTNNVVVGEIERAQSPEAIDEHLVDEDEHSGLMIADKSVPFTAESEHLADVVEDDSLEADGGTHEVGRAIEEGEPWIPPDGPTPEGVSGQENLGTFGHDTQH